MIGLEQVGSLLRSFLFAITPLASPSVPRAWPIAAETHRSAARIRPQTLVLCGEDGKEIPIPRLKSPRSVLTVCLAWAVAQKGLGSIHST